MQAQDFAPGWRRRRQGSRDDGGDGIRCSQVNKSCSHDDTRKVCGDASGVGVGEESGRGGLRDAHWLVKRFYQVYCGGWVHTLKDDQFRNGLLCKLERCIIVCITKVECLRWQT